MGNFEVPENLEYIEQIRKFETTDPGHADLFNAVIQTLVNNETFLKKVTEQHEVAVNECVERSNHIYRGRDLAIAFASEIAFFSDEWAWIKDRIQKADYTGIHVGDYIPIIMDNKTVKMQVAGIDTYYRMTDRKIGHHIDFISKDCFNSIAIAKWNADNTNNGKGSGASSYPYMASDLKASLTTRIYNFLPEAVKSVISNKRMLMEGRFSDSGLLTDSTTSYWCDLGYLWVPTEYEVFGSAIYGTKPWSCGQGVQYPIFANDSFNRIKCNKDGGSACSWWLATVSSGNSNRSACVGSYGQSSEASTSSTLTAPVCFRIMEEILS